MLDENTIHQLAKEKLQFNGIVVKHEIIQTLTDAVIKDSKKREAAFPNMSQRVT